LAQLMVTPGTPGSQTVAASVRSATGRTAPQPRTIESPRAGARASDVWLTLALFAGSCSVCRVVASCNASQHKRSSCTVACQAAEVPMPIMFQPHIPVTEKLMPTVMQQCMSFVAAHTKTSQTMLESQKQHYCAGLSPIAAQITELQNGAFRARMVGGARNVARQAKQRKTADRAAASRAARRAVGSRLKAASCHEGVPPPTFDVSRQRLKIQAGVHSDNRERSGHMHEIRSPAGTAKKLNGLFAPHFIMLEDIAYS